MELHSRLYIWSIGEGSGIPGVEVKSDFSHSFCHVTTVKITSKEGESALKKPIGTYVTLESEQMNEQMEKIDQKIIQTTAKLIQEVAHLSTNDSVLIVGLGNQNVTPDSLGPSVVEQIQVTRHLLYYTPEYLPQNTRAVSAIIPRCSRHDRHRNFRYHPRNCRENKTRFGHRH